MKRYEVESELNPRYLETGETTDYYGLYHVVSYDADGNREIVKTFDGTYTNARAEAYKYANFLSWKQSLP